MVDDNKELVEKMLVAFLTEKSAQCGEPFYMDMWEEYKREKPEEYHEEFVQMQCALSIIQPELQKRDEEIAVLREALEYYASGECYYYPLDKDTRVVDTRTAENALKTTTGHDL